MRAIREKRLVVVIVLFLAALAVATAVRALYAQDGELDLTASASTSNSTEVDAGDGTWAAPEATSTSKSHIRTPSLDDRSHLIGQAEWFFKSYEIAEFTDWLILDEATDIPVGEDAINHPLDFQDIVEPPRTSQVGSVFQVVLYTWTGDMGMLARWELTIEEDTLTHLSGRVVDVLVGEVTRVRTEGPFLPTPGKLITDERKNVPLP